MVKVPKYFPRATGAVGPEGEPGDKGEAGDRSQWRLYIMGDHPNAIPGETYSDPSVGDGWLAMGDAYVRRDEVDEIGGGTLIHHGLGPPSELVGQVGEYYLDTQNQILYGPKNFGDDPDVPPPEPPPEEAIYGPAVNTYSNQAPDTYGTSLNPIETYGSDIQIASNGRITGLRHYRHVNAMPSDTGRTLRLWDSSGSQLAAATTTGEVVPGSWQPVTLAEPIPITAGQTVRVSEDVQQDRIVSLGSMADPTGPGLAVTGSFTGIGPGRPTTEGGFLPFVDIAFEPLLQEAGMSDPWPVALVGAQGGGDGITEAEADGRYVNAEGDVVAGWLELWVPPEMGVHAARYADGIPRFPSTSDRDAFYTDLLDPPSVGMMSRVTTQSWLDEWNGTAWVPHIPGSINFSLVQDNAPMTIDVTTPGSWNIGTANYGSPALSWDSSGAVIPIKGVYLITNILKFSPSTPATNTGFRVNVLLDGTAARSYGIPGPAQNRSTFTYATASISMAIAAGQRFSVAMDCGLSMTVLQHAVVIFGPVMPNLG